MLGIALQQALAFQIAADALCDALRQFGELGARGCSDPVKAKRAALRCTPALLIRWTLSVSPDLNAHNRFQRNQCFAFLDRVR